MSIEIRTYREATRRRRNVISACVVLLTLAVVASGSAQADLVQNGDFESISPFFAIPGSPVTTGGWTFENHGGVVDPGGNPGRAARLESGGDINTDPTISQTVSGLSIGTEYNLSWDLRLRVNFGGSGTGRSFGAFLDSQTFANALRFDEYLSTTYKSDSVSFLATSTSHTLIFAGELDSRTNGLVGSTDVSYNIDNISLSAVPEPSSCVLCGLVFVVGLGFCRRRTRAASK